MVSIWLKNKKLMEYILPREPGHKIKTEMYRFM